MRIEIVDWGAGNVASLRWALKRLGIETTTEGGSSQGRILPGVGSFGAVVQGIRTLRPDVPTLGICLGMQAFFVSSEESPGVSGLEWLKGKCEHAKTSIVPHKGWEEDGFWYDHSYVVVPEEPEIVFARFEHCGRSFPSIIKSEHLWGCQFHPEKSGDNGLSFLERWVSSW